MLRGFRDHLYIVFERNGFANGFYHWSNERLFAATKDFMTKVLRMPTPSDIDVWCVAYLLYPTRGIETKEKYIG